MIYRIYDDDENNIRRADGEKWPPPERPHRFRSVVNDCEVGPSDGRDRGTKLRLICYLCCADVEISRARVVRSVSQRVAITRLPVYR
jgi:hypothetical protein